MNNIESEFVPYQQSLELKEIGFDEPCLAKYNRESNFVLDNSSLFCRNKHPLLDKLNQVSTPFYQQAFKWFRNKYKLFSSIERESAEHFFCNYSIKEYDGIKNIDHRGKGYRKEEEAELACLNKLIEIIKTRN